MTTAHDIIREYAGSNPDHHRQLITMLHLSVPDAAAIVAEFDALTAERDAALRAKQAQAEGCAKLAGERDALKAESSHLHAEADLAYDQRRRALSDRDECVVSIAKERDALAAQLAEAKAAAAVDHVVAEAARDLFACLVLIDSADGIAAMINSDGAVAALRRMAAALDARRGGGNG